MMLALPPVGLHNTVAQPEHMTAVWAWENTGVLRQQPRDTPASDQSRNETNSLPVAMQPNPSAEPLSCRPGKSLQYVLLAKVIAAARACIVGDWAERNESFRARTHIWSQPGQRTSMKKELGA